MNYYIIDKKIIAYENALDTELYNYDKLDPEQAEFYELHKCSLSEVLNLTLNPKYEPTLDELKASKINHFSTLAFDLREAILPEYKIMNAGLPDVYDPEEVLKIARVVTEFRTEFYRLKGLVEQATTVEELEAIEDNYHLITMG